MKFSFRIEQIPTTFNDILIIQSQDDPLQSQLRQYNMHNYISFVLISLSFDSRTNSNSEGL